MKSSIRLVFTVALMLVTLSAFAKGKGESQTGELITVAQLEQMLQEQELMVLDIRSEVSYIRGHIPGALLVHPSRVEDAAQELVSFNRPLVTYCSCPAEETSGAAALTLKNKGAQTVYVLKGGFEEWADTGRPVVTGMSTF